MFLRTKRGWVAALAARRAFRRLHGVGINYVRNVSPVDGAYNWSAWRGLTYLGPVSPEGFSK